MFKNSREACPEYYRGDSEIFVLVIVILGAFLLAGGQLLFQSNADSGLSQPSANAGGGAAATPPAAGAATDYIKVLSSNGCDNTNHQGNSSIGVTAPAAGYISFGLKDAGSPQFTKSYTPPSQSMGLTLSNSDGFNTKPWQIQLFSGGTQNGTTWSGGTIAASKDMDPTGCL